MSCTGVYTNSCETTSLTAPISSPTARDPKKPTLRQNQFGGTVGGPVIKNRTFFFFSYQGTRIRRGKSFFPRYPARPRRDGNFANEGLNRNRIYDPLTTVGTGAAAIRQPFPGNIIPTSRFDPVTKPIIDQYPLPNVTGRDFQPNNFFFAPSDIDTGNEYDIKIDHNFSERDRTFFRWSIRRDDKLQNGPLPLSAFGGGLGQTVSCPVTIGWEAGRARSRPPCTMRSVLAIRTTPRFSISSRPRTSTRNTA